MSGKVSWRIIFSGLMWFRPWKACSLIITRYGCGRGVRTLNSVQQSRAMAFAEVPHRSSLRGLAPIAMAAFAGLSFQASRAVAMPR